MRIARFLLLIPFSPFVSLVPLVSAVTMNQLCDRARAIKAIEPRKFSCVIDIVYRDQTGEYNTYDISGADPRAVFRNMQLTNEHSFQNLVYILYILLLYRLRKQWINNAAI